MAPVSRQAVESVWDYPRPPRVEPSTELIQVFLGDVLIVESRRGVRVLETSHPPVYYLPFADVRDDVLERSPGRRSFCEFKGFAVYWSAAAGGVKVADVAWSYPEPSPGFETLRDHVAFYPGRVGACFVDGEEVAPQDGDFYGGWITSRVQGPFKGGPGTGGW